MGRSRYPEGVYARGKTLWIRYSVHGKDIRDPTGLGLTKGNEAAKLRAERLTEHGHGLRTVGTDKLTVNDLLDALRTNYEVNGFGLETLDGHLKALRPAFGRTRASDLTTDHVEVWQVKWLKAGFTEATVNRRCNALRRAFKIALERKRVRMQPYIPRLQEHAPRGRYISPTDKARLREALPDYARVFLDVAYDVGIRKGQLAKTLRRNVSMDLETITWDPSQCTKREAHTLPLEGSTLAIVAALIKRPPMHCPYLFHGPDCAPSRKPSKRYACIGDFKMAWKAACNAAGLPAGRKVGGYVFHNTRNSAASNLRAGGMGESEAMDIGGWKTHFVFDWYDIKDVEQLRAKLKLKSAYVEGLTNPDKQRVNGN